jgi:hypothetical protein
VAVGGLSLISLLALPASAGAVTQTFNFTGAAQTFTVPAGVTQVTVDAFGAQGGQAQDGTAGGLGGEAMATIAVTPGEVLQVNVGGQPATGNPAPGGFNGGGPSGTATGGIFNNGGGGGGGASDVRQGGTGLGDRAVIAGGGGGGGGSAGPCTGGGGGGTGGDDGSPCSNLQGRGGTQSSGGAAGANGGGAGASGTGGSGQDQSGGTGTHSGGGGGGGLFGGGGGSGGQPEDSAGAGGGGSGFTQSGTGMTNGVRSGSGLITITYTVTPTLTTNASANTTIGHQIRDTAKLTHGASPTGTITFRLYGPDDDSCTGAPAFTSAKTVSGNGGHPSDKFRPTVPGIYHWTARYSGDSDNAAVTKPCSSPKESTWVEKASPVLSTQASLTNAGRILDTAKLTGGHNPSGELAFKLYGPNDANCSRAPVFTDRVTVSGNGGYQPRTFNPTAAGTYRFTATLPGDSNNRAAHSECNAAGESVTVR